MNENIFKDTLQKLNQRRINNAKERNKPRDLQGNEIINGTNSQLLKLSPGAQQRFRDAMKNSYEPEGEMVEANAEQMKAMHDAKMKKKEDDKVKEKKKVDEACWKGYEKKGMKTMFGKRYPNCVKKTKKEEVQIADENFMRDKSYVQRYKKQGGYLNSPARKKADAKYAKDNPKRKPFEKRKIGTLAGNKLNDEVQYEEKDKKGKGSGTKDACYHKVKSRYSVWPSAYASGALVKCRKAGAKNWGNSSKKEEFDYYQMPMKSFGDMVGECWKTHKKVGMKMKGGKMVPDCRPKNESVEEAVKSPKLDIKETGVKNKIEINPEIKTEAAKAPVKK